ncbi:MAG: hypothetical protein KVP17_000519 [Porospora cf. gigantea B]|uniref:uncharacterized protein n=1 Tax=Porospora cf. gigantea B TaxID=2853592 RepID=UPI003571D999|nr:MAG: hypothetical protein KVP17_000519 [Porospora cf. gigantea B]
MSLSDPLKPDELLKFRTNYCEPLVASHPGKRLLQSGICRFAGSCQYSHTSEWCRRDLVGVGSRSHQTRTNYCARLCSHVRLDGEGIVSVALSTCEAGKCCPFAHTLEEVFYHPDVYKTLPCSKVMEHPFQCDREYCPFAHSPEELRPSTHPTNLLRLTNFTLPRYTSQESRHNIHRRLPCAHIVRHVNADTREIHPNLLVERGELEVFTWSCAQGLFQGRLVIVWLLPLPMETLEFAERFAARVGCAFPQVVQSGTCQLETLTCLFVVQVAGLQMISTPVSDKESFAREVLGQLEALRQQGIYVDALDQYSVMYDSESGTPAVQFPYKSLLLAVARTFGLLRDHPELTRALIGVPDCYWKPPEVVLQDFRLSQDRTLSSASGLADHALTWSAGCYLAYMTAGVHPFGSMDDLEGLLLNAATNDLVNFRIGDLWTQMLGMMLDARPTERKNLQSALHHPALWSHKTWTAVTSGITGLSPVILPLVDRLPGLPTAQMKNTGLTFSGTSDVVLNSELLLMCAANPKSAVSLLSMHAPLAMALAQLLPCHE